MAELDKLAIEQWEKGNVERSLAARCALGTWYSILPKFLGWKPSLGRLLFGGIRYLFLTILVLWPIWIKFYDKTANLTWEEAYWLSFFMAGMVLYNHAYDRVAGILKSRNVKAKLVHKLSQEMRGIIANLSPYVKRAKVEHQVELDKARRKVLECIRRISQIHVKDYEGTCIEVTLWVFHDPDCKKMKILDRTTDARPAGKVVDSEGLMAYYVARGRKHRIVNDFLHDLHPFPKSGLTVPGEPPYRSILLIPLLDNADGAPNNCLGVVSIDSSQPYHFWPGTGSELVQKVSPYCAWLSVLLTLAGPIRLRCTSDISSQS